MNWNGQPVYNFFIKEENPSFDMTSATALTSIIDNVNNLISILRDPSDTTTLRTGNSNIDLSSTEHYKMSRHLYEASRGLSKICYDYKVPNSTPALVEQAPKISTPQTNFLVSSFRDTGHDSSFTLPKHHKHHFEPSIDNECISIGKIFKDVKDAALVFQQYAVACGFNICKGNSKKDVYQEYSCSARGKVRMRKIPDQSKCRNRKSIKKMCKCHIILRKKDDDWIITTRKLYHTHELLSPDEIKKTAKNRFIPDEFKKKAIDLYESGEAPAKIQYQFENEMGSMCTWSMKDLYNMLYRHKS
jgi:hypothetical protein